MTQCHECRIHPAFPITPAFQQSFRDLKQRPNQSYSCLPSFGFKESAALPDKLKLTLPFGDIMPTTRKDAVRQHPRTSQPTVVPGVPEQWYECLDETGAIPFIDDDPPFYLHNSASDAGSILALQTGHGSQPAPLSHSLLSRLELSENDPNTFREVIDDLTVQNKRLKKRLKKYERIGTKGLNHDGLFELRIQNLPHDKKQELEAILQRFASTIRPQPNKMVSNLAGSGRSRDPRSRAVGNNPSLSSPPYTSGLDSAYASVSATGATLKPTSGRSANSTSRSRNYISSSAEQGLSASTTAGFQHVESPSLSETSDRYKQKLVVERLEKLFLTENGDMKSIIESNLHASPTVESSAESQHGWVYLNLLINLAQLHTLNVTPEHVRLGIQEFSTKLMLSEDGSAVKWRGDLERGAGNSNNPNGIANTSIALTTTSLTRPESQIQLPKCQVPLHVHENTGSGDENSLEGVDNLQTSAVDQGAAKRLQYKPIFARHRHRPYKSSYVSSEGSRSSSSHSGEQYVSDVGESANASNGPMVFFDADAFFIDLSSDITDADDAAAASHSSYADYNSVLLGQRNDPPIVSSEYERRQDIAISGCKHNEEWTRSTPLLVHGINPTPFHDEERPDDGEKQLYHFQASGIGGIQLADNFAIDVKTSLQAASHLQQQRLPSIKFRDNKNTSSNSRPLYRLPRQPRASSTHIISTTTTHLPPSPLPPPSYVYPALSSTSSESEDGYSSMDDLDSEPDYELRKVSLSPQVRAWVQEQSMSPHGALGGGERSEGIESDEDGDGDSSVDGDEDGD